MALDLVAGFLGALFVAAQDASYRGRTLLRVDGTAEDVTAGLGSEICVLGDVDGDGTRDLALARSKSGNWTGGKPSVTVVSGATGETIWAVEAGMFDVLLGASLTPLGDLDGDDVGDLLVGTPTDMGDPSDMNNFAWVLSGRDGRRLLEMHGNTVLCDGGGNDQFGISTAAAGDMDGDGIGDFWVGSTVARGELGEWLSLGRVRAFSGSTGQELRRFDAPKERVAGWLLATLGDVDGDGVLDIATAGSWAASWLFVLSGATAKPIHEVLLGISQITALANAGDLDNDGVDDLAVGSSFDAAGKERGTGAVLLVSSATGKEVGRLQGDESRAGFGAALATLPDLDGDGVGELGVGAPRYSMGWGRVEIRSPISGRLILAENGQREWGEFGYALDAADLDGDGTVELLVSQPGEIGWSHTPDGRTADWGSWHGAVHVISIERVTR
jgi:hypothetical protein